MAVSGDAKGVVVACASCGRKNRLPYDKLGQAAECGQCGTALPSLAAPVEVPSVEAFDRLTSAAPVPVLVDFWAPWCGPCRMVAPEMEKVAVSNAGWLVVAKVNTEALPQLASRFSIYSIPTMSVFSGGREVGRTAGARPAAAIQEFVEQSTGGVRRAA